MKQILIHGLGQTPSSFDETISHLNEDNITCPNLSALMSDNETSYLNLYKSLSNYLDNISEPINLCGLSLGAVLSLNYVIDNPDKVKSLILIAPQYDMPKALLKFQNIVFKFLPEKSFNDMGMTKNDFIKLTNSMMDIDFSNKLKNISCDTLIICGEKDMPNKKASKTLNNNIKNSQIKFIKGAGHEVNVDKPKELALMINDFILSTRTNI